MVCSVQILNNNKILCHKWPKKKQTKYLKHFYSVLLSFSKGAKFVLFTFAILLFYFT